MKCAAYLRRSVDRDREERSVSIESQRSAIIAWAEKAGATILEEWTLGDGYSGSSFSPDEIEGQLGNLQGAIDHLTHDERRALNGGSTVHGDPGRPEAGHHRA